MYNNIVVTTANSPYYRSLLTLINGIHKFGLMCVDRIIVFNLGLDESEVEVLRKIKLVDVVEYPSEVVNSHPTFLEPKSHVYKLFCLEYSKNFGDNILWLDAGCVPINPMCEMFETISNEEIFMVGDTHLTKTYTHSDCVRIMSATEDELDDVILSSGIIGFKNNGKYTKLFQDAYNYSLIDGCVNGDQENHRHDQSVLSILATRYKCPKQNIDKYGYWTDINRNLQTALEQKSVIFVHRRGYDNVSDIIYEN